MVEVHLLFTQVCLLMLAICSPWLLGQALNCTNNIEWWGDESGSVPTDETSRTEAATDEAYTAVFGQPVCRF